MVLLSSLTKLLEVEIPPSLNLLFNKTIYSRNLLFYALRVDNDLFSA